MKVILALLCLGALAGCASTEFRAFESANNYYEGTGATKSVVDGMDIWDDKPPRKFSVMGVLFDKRRQGPFMATMLDGDMVKQARRQGGDALVRMGESSTFQGLVGNAFSSGYSSRGLSRGTGFGTSIPIVQTAAQATVIKSLDRSPNPASATSLPGGTAPPAASTSVQPTPASPSVTSCFLNTAGKCIN
jgi:hypothetical protein